MKSLSAFVTAVALAGWMSPAAATESPAVPPVPPVPPVAAVSAEGAEGPEDVTETVTKDDDGNVTKTIVRRSGKATKGAKDGKNVEKKRNVRVFAVEGAKITREETADGYVMRVVVPKSSKEGKSMMDLPTDDGSGESVYVFSNKPGLMDMSDRHHSMVIRVPKEGGKDADNLEIEETVAKALADAHERGGKRVIVRSHSGDSGDEDDLRSQLKETNKALEKLNEQMKKLREEMAKSKK